MKNTLFIEKLKCKDIIFLFGISFLFYDFLLKGLGVAIPV